MEFEIDDIVELDSGGLRIVTGVIHDDERLFVSELLIHNSEVEIPFSDVVRRWTEKAL